MGTRGRRLSLAGSTTDEEDSVPYSSSSRRPVENRLHKQQVDVNLRETVNTAAKLDKSTRNVMTRRRIPTSIAVTTSINYNAHRKEENHIVQHQSTHFRERMGHESILLHNKAQHEGEDGLSREQNHVFNSTYLNMFDAVKRNRRSGDIDGNSREVRQQESSGSHKGDEGTGKRVRRTYSGLFVPCYSREKNVGALKKGRRNVISTAKSTAPSERYNQATRIDPDPLVVFADTKTSKTVAAVKDISPKKLRCYFRPIEVPEQRNTDKRVRETKPKSIVRLLPPPKLNIPSESPGMSLHKDQNLIFQLEQHAKACLQDIHSAHFAPLNNTQRLAQSLPLRESHMLQTPVQLSLIKYSDNSIRTHMDVVPMNGPIASHQLLQRTDEVVGNTMNDVKDPSREIATRSDEARDNYNENGCKIKNSNLDDGSTEMSLDVVTKKLHEDRKSVIERIVLAAHNPLADHTGIETSFYERQSKLRLHTSQAQPQPQSHPRRKESAAVINRGPFQYARTIHVDIKGNDTVVTKDTDSSSHRYTDTDLTVFSNNNDKGRCTTCAIENAAYMSVSKSSQGVCSTSTISEIEEQHRVQDQLTNKQDLVDEISTETHADEPKLTIDGNESEVTRTKDETCSMAQDCLDKAIDIVADCYDHQDGQSNVCIRPSMTGKDDLSQKMNDSSHQSIAETNVSCEVSGKESSASNSITTTLELESVDPKVRTMVKATRKHRVRKAVVSLFAEPVRKVARLDETMQIQESADTTDADKRATIVPYSESHGALCQKLFSSNTSENDDEKKMSGGALVPDKQRARLNSSFDESTTSDSTKQDDVISVCSNSSVEEHHTRGKDGAIQLFEDDLDENPYYNWQGFDAMIEKACTCEYGCSLEELEEGREIRGANNAVASSDSTTQGKAQYGRLLPKACDLLFKKVLEIDEDDVFVDIGHGIGTIVLQAAYTMGCESRGVELVRSRNDVALKLQEHLARLHEADIMYNMGQKDVGDINFLKGQLEAVHYRLQLTNPGRKSKCFANNFNGVYGDRSEVTDAYELGTYVAALFAMMEPGSIIATLDPLPIGMPREEVNTMRAKTNWQVSPNASFFELEHFDFGEARHVASWSQFGSNCNLIGGYKYTRVQQASTKAVFFCSNFFCENAKCGVPIPAVVEVTTESGAKRYVMNSCDLCSGSSRPIRRRYVSRKGKEES